MDLAELRAQLRARAAKAGEESAAKLTLNERAERARAAFRGVLLQVVPAAFQRIPLAKLDVELASDERAVELAELVLAQLLGPGEVR